jgi:hypothetical protein
MNSFVPCVFSSDREGLFYRSTDREPLPELMIIFKSTTHPNPNHTQPS